MDINFDLYKQFIKKSKFIYDYSKIIYNYVNCSIIKIIQHNYNIFGYLLFTIEGTPLLQTKDSNKIQSINYLQKKVKSSIIPNQYKLKKYPIQQIKNPKKKIK